MLPHIPSFRAQIPQLSSSFHRSFNLSLLGMDAQPVEQSHSDSPTTFSSFARLFVFLLPLVELRNGQDFWSDHPFEFCCPFGLWVRWGIGIEFIEASGALVISNFLTLFLYIQLCVMFDFGSSSVLFFCSLSWVPEGSCFQGFDFDSVIMNLGILLGCGQLGSWIFVD